MISCLTIEPETHDVVDQATNQYIGSQGKDRGNEQRLQGIDPVQDGNLIDQVNHDRNHENTANVYPSFSE